MRSILIPHAFLRTISVLRDIQKTRWVYTHWKLIFSSVQCRKLRFHIAWHCHAQRQLHQTIALVVLCTGRSCLFHLSVTDRDTRVVMRYLGGVGASLLCHRLQRDLAQSLTTVTDLSCLGRVHVLSLSSRLGSVLFWIFLITSWVT